MLAKRLTTVALLSLVVVSACSDDDNGITGTTNTSTVRFVNATGTTLAFQTGGSTSATNANIGYGASSSCSTVNANSAGLGVNIASTGAAVTGFTQPTLNAGGNYTIIAYPDANGVTHFATVNTNGFTPTSGQSGLSVFNAGTAGTNYDVYITNPGGTIGTAANASSVGYGTGSTYFNTTSGTQQVQITNAGSRTVLMSIGGNNFTAGQNSILVIAPPATGTTTLRSFLVPGC